MTKRVLIITRHILSQNNGGANATKSFINCFSALFNDCSLICPIYDSHANSIIPHKIKVFSYEDHRNRIQKGLDCWRGRICANELFVKQHLKEHYYDIVVIDHSFSGASLAKTIKATGAKLITIHHNVECNYQYDNRKDYSLLFRWPYIHHAIKAERMCLRYSDTNLTLTESDAREFQSWYPDTDLHIHIWGTFEYRPIETKTFIPRNHSHQFVITGSLNFVQSLFPIMEFIDDYWPIAKQECPDAKLIIAGRNPSDVLIRKCNKDARIMLIPNPDNIESVVQEANYYICPINLGSGLKLRIMDGLKQGLPVLCHEVSIAGYEQIAAGNGLFSYQDETSFRTALQEMLSTDINPNDIFQLYKETFSLDTGIERLHDILTKEHYLP